MRCSRRQYDGTARLARTARHGTPRHATARHGTPRHATACHGAAAGAALDAFTAALVRRVRGVGAMRLLQPVATTDGSRQRVRWLITSSGGWNASRPCPWRTHFDSLHRAPQSSIAPLYLLYARLSRLDCCGAALRPRCDHRCAVRYSMPTTYSVTYHGPTARPRTWACATRRVT